MTSTKYLLDKLKFCENIGFLVYYFLETGEIQRWREKSTRLGFLSSHPASATWQCWVRLFWQSLQSFLSHRVSARKSGFHTVCPLRSPEAQTLYDLTFGNIVCILISHYFHNYSQVFGLFLFQNVPFRILVFLEPHH